MRRSILFERNIIKLPLTIPAQVRASDIIVLTIIDLSTVFCGPV